MSSSTIYNHRTLQPTAPPPPGSVPVSAPVPVPVVPQQPPHPHTSAARLDECLETLRREFEIVTQDINVLRSQRDDFDSKISGQVNELSMIKNHIYQLEERHKIVKQSYDEELSRLRRELEAARQGIAVPPGVYRPLSGRMPSESGPRDPGSADAGPRTAIPVSAPGNPPPGYPYPDYRDRDRGRERERDIDRERERDPRERERDHMRERVSLDRMGLDRERIERERLMDRERERDRVERERETGRERERDVKRKDRERKPDYYGPPGAPVKGGATGPGSPHPHPHGFHPNMGQGATDSRKHPMPVVYDDAGPLPSPQGPPPNNGMGLVGNGIGRNVGGMGGNVGGSVPFHTPGTFPDEFDPNTTPPELKKEGPDWLAVFSKHVPQRRLDVNLLHTLDHESVVCCVRFSADGKYLATGCNRSAQIYDTKTGAQTCELIDEAAAKLRDLYIRSLCFSPDGKYLATGAEDKQIRIWDIAKKRIRTVFEGHTQEIYSLDFSRDGRYIISGSGDKTARMWELDTGKHRIYAINDPPETDAGVTSVAISADGKYVAAGSLDTFVRIWDSQTGQLVDQLKGHTDSVYSVAFTPDGKGLVSGSLDQTLKHWDLSPLQRRGRPGFDGVKKEEKCQCITTFNGHKDYVLSVAVSHDSQWVVSGSKDRCVQFWDLRTGQAQLMLQGHKNSVISIDLSPTGGMLATGSGDWGARLCT
ncbi:hypothetical protein M422DRAFT_60773 [Sphaerobolus stellatus SS14]|uniref:Transcriptional repressor Tup1 N-terminal domain-containing protein n=1 Tax=Sphaerobolus stellatus (strain SS14) TaxID=990650 RepID=A0A0C9UVN2_SPHS4|nr:hypothetical protein M422DRAFT_60773 [Sphaerobolus stellatus SS14]